MTYYDLVENRIGADYNKMDSISGMITSLLEDTDMFTLVLRNDIKNKSTINIVLPYYIFDTKTVDQISIHVASKFIGETKLKNNIKIISKDVLVSYNNDNFTYTISMVCES